ncbi:MAG: hypothetical protein JW891_02990 [Candidatus Lokiarchaeota archaeon]|nr:hypothetical protein [Candidatus Lokiarchaeota archaeon]
MKKKVKGSLAKILVRSVRSNKTGVYEDILSREGQELINQRIFDSIWYSYEAYRNVHDAVAKVEANNNQKILFQWGQKFGDALMTSIYKNTVSVIDIKMAIDRYKRFHNLLYNGGILKHDFLSSSHLRVIYDGFERDWELYYYISSGWMHKFLELCLNKDIAFSFHMKSWEGAQWTVYDFSW